MSANKITIQGANRYFSNLLATAINTSLISDTDSTDDLGSSAKKWANLYVDDIILGDTPTITTESNANLSLVPNGTGYTIIGDAGVTSHAFNTNDDLLVSGRLEVNGVAYFDTSVVFSAGISSGFIIYGVGAIIYGTGNGNQTDTLLLTGGNTDRTFIFTTYANRNKDFDHTAQTNPTLFIHSATDPDTANTQWLSLTHDQTDSVLTSGAGDIKLDGNVNITGNLEIDNVQVITNRVVDARIDDTPNSGDATTDGIIDALRDAMITHGLIAAA